MIEFSIKDESSLQEAYEEIRRCQKVGRKFKIIFSKKVFKLLTGKEVELYNGKDLTVSVFKSI